MASNPFDQFDAQANPFDKFDSHLHHFVDAQGAETYSKNPAPAGSKPYAAPTAADVSAPENFAAGVGKAFVDPWRGIKQIASHYGLGDQSAVQQEVDQSAKADQPLMNSKAGIAGNIGGYAAQAAAAGPEGLLTNIALGSGMGAVQPTVTGGASRTFNTIAGGALTGAGTAIGKLAGRAAQPIKNVLSPEGAANVAELASQGIPLDVGQRTGSAAIQRMITSLGDNPATVGKYTAFRDTQNSAFNKAVLKNMGVTSEKATPEIMGAGKRAITNVMNDVAERVNPAMDAKLSSDIQSIQQDAFLNEKAQSFVQRVADRLTRAADESGNINGREFNKTYSAIGRESRNPEYAEYARRLRGAMQDSMMRSGGPEDAAAIANARTQYQAMKQISPAVDASGNISVKKLAATLMNSRNRGQSIFGEGNQSLVKLAKAARDVLPEPLANSGTPARMESAAAPVIAVEAGTKLLEGKPLHAAGLLGGAFVLPRLGTPLLGQGRFANYLVNGPQSPLAKALLSGVGSAPSRMVLSQVPQRRLLQKANEPTQTEQ